jgi:hypothetical protein
MPFDITKLTGNYTNTLLGVSGIGLIISIPLLALLTAGFRLLFNLPRINRTLGPVFFLLWMAGIILVCAGGFKIGKLYASGYEYSKNDTLKINSDTINLTAIPTMKNEVRMFYHYSSRTGAYSKDIFKVNPKVKLSVLPGEEKYIYLTEFRKSRGETAGQAAALARNFSYNYKVNNNEIAFDKILNVSPKDPYRGQELELELYIPAGKIIKFSPQILSIWNNIPNRQNMSDNEMPDHLWKMTTKGLECMDCPPSKHQKNEDEEEENQDNSPGAANIRMKGLQIISL